MLPADVIVASVFLLLSITVEWLNAQCTAVASTGRVFKAQVA